MDHGISANLWLSSFSPGLVPVYEEHSARLERGINLDSWANMQVEEKALIVAIRRTKRAEENLLAEAEIEKSERKV